MSTGPSVLTIHSSTPPLIKSCKSYKDWKRLIKHWSKIAGLKPNEQASAILLSLTGEDLDAALQVPEEDLDKDDGLDALLKRLDTLYLKDELAEKFGALEAFQTYSRPSSASIRDFIIEFEKRHFKIKNYGAGMTDDLLAYRLIKAANLPADKEQLIKATVSELTYVEVKTKMTKIFDSATPASATADTMQDTFHSEQHISDNQLDKYDDQESSTYSDEEDAFYANSRWNSRRPPNRSQRRQPERSASRNWRTDRPDDKKGIPRARNRLDRFGNVTRCVICDSVNHYAPTCPDRQNNDNNDKETYIVHEIALHANNTKKPENIKSLLAETWSSGLLDCGANKTVCGAIWLQEYIKSLPKKDASLVSYYPTETCYRFGDGERVKSVKAALIPAFLGNERTLIRTDIVDKDLPLLLSKGFMKNANMVLDFSTDSLKMNGKTLPLNTTSSGHYSLSLTRSTQLLANIDKIDTQRTPIILTARKEMSDIQIASKLHRQFAHPCKEKLLQLVKHAGSPWSNNTTLLDAISSVSAECDICIRYQKSPPRPVVGLPMASQFLETVAMDLKHYNGKWILHLIDMCTRLSAASVIPNKKPDTVIQHLMQVWISVYGSADKFLVDNGGEFANKDLIEVAERFGITIKPTAAFSPWSNGTIERHNQTLGSMLDKVLADSPCCLETALAWCLNAKNSLSNVHGFTPYQLSIGTNPRLPSTLTDSLPALSSCKPNNAILAEHLYALHKARQAYIESENSDRIKRALSHNVRSSGDVKYFSGDKVYYKRDDSSCWHGPGKVLGQDGQQILVKHGSFYVRVHPCRIKLVPNVTPTSATPELSEPTIENTENAPAPSNTPTANDHFRISVPQKSPTNTSDASIEGPVTEPARIPETSSDNSSETIGTPSEQSTAEVSQHPTSQLLSKIRQGTVIEYVNNQGDNITANVASRAGKAKGKYPHWWNVHTKTGDTEAVDFSKMTIQKVSDPAEHNDSVTLIASSKEAVNLAKQRELNEWKSQNVYTEVEDNGQDLITLRWVCQPKVIDGQASVKARLCARGFEEESDIRSDSPTCSREGVRIALTLIAAQKWKVNSLDVKTAFLQGRAIDRDIYVRPPKEADTTMIWKLKKTVYGLNDASRSWYLKLREELVDLNATPIDLDLGIFC